MEPFTVRIVVRGYETDSQGHLNQSVYLQYAEHGRWCALEHGGIRQSDLLAKGIGPVTMENTIRYRRELRAGDEVDVSCAFKWSDGKSFRIEQAIRRVDDGTTAAEVTAVCGILDLAERKLVPDPRAVFHALATDKAVFGL
ncbi:thioesterase family protein [Streptomyces xanthochromogenes]|uniref:acyl-CoA thioesterase n=1 Tax=Streptomyces xanthochromogenes TaxID=67384 RepID=UPI0034154810